jgi:hypothetical protein
LPYGRGGSNSGGRTDRCSKDGRDVTININKNCFSSLHYAENEGQFSF